MAKICKCSADKYLVDISTGPTVLGGGIVLVHYEMSYFHQCQIKKDSFN